MVGLAPSGLPHILSTVDYKSLFPGEFKSRSRSPTKRQRRRSDAEIDAEIVGEAYKRGRHHRRQRRDDSAGGGAHEGNKSAESSKAIPTPKCTEGIDSSRYT